MNAVLLSVFCMAGITLSDAADLPRTSSNVCYQCHNFGLFQISGATEFALKLGLTTGVIVGGGHYCGDTFQDDGSTPRIYCSHPGEKCVKLEDSSDNIIRGCIPKVKADLYCSN